MVYPVLRGKDVGRWTADTSGHIVAPYRQTAMGEVLPNAEFRTEFPETYGWLSRFRQILRNRKIVNTLKWKMDQDDWPQIMGTSFMTGDPCVVVREMAKRPAAAVVLKRYDDQLGRTTTVLVDHKLVFCAVKDAEEAHYLAAMVNAEPMQLLLESFLNEVSIAPATLARLPIPEYDEDTHAPLVKAAQAAERATADRDAAALTSAEADVNALVLQALEAQSEAAEAAADAA